MNSFYCVYDYETDGKNPEECNPVQVACVMLDPYTLNIVNGSEFCSDMRPPDIDKEEYFTKDVLDTINWHAKIRGVTADEIIERWKAAPPEKAVYNLFSKHINKYNKEDSQWTAPISAGMNIRNFDNIITKRLNEKYKISRMFNHEVCDLRDIAFLWLQWNRRMRSRSLDKIREEFGMSTDGGHDALVDTKDTAIIIAKFLALHKNLYPKIQFKDCLKETVK